MARKRGQKGHLVFNPLCFLLKKVFIVVAAFCGYPFSKKDQKMNELNTVWNFMNLSHYIFFAQYAIRNAVKLMILCDFSALKISRFRISEAVKV